MADTSLPPASSVSSTEPTFATRAVKGQWNSMAVCSVCDRHDLKTRMAYCCVDAVNGDPMICDDCRITLAHAHLENDDG
jgi:hypothetical protein